MRFVVAILLSAAAVVAQTTRPGDDDDRYATARSELARRAEQSIARGVEFLLSRQNPDGSWGEGEPTDTDGGRTALVTLAMLSCGQSHQSPPIDRAIKFLKRAQTQKANKATYSTALRACVYAQLPEALRQQELRSDLRWLQEAIIDRGDRRGMYDYTKGRVFGGDYSNSQYGVLGAWYGAQAGLMVSPSYWKAVEDGWRAGQNDDGGWGYVPRDGRSRASLTAAGAATLFITNDYLHSRDAENLAAITTNKPLEDAIRWLADNFAVDHNPGLDSSFGEPQNQPGAGISRPYRADGSVVHYMLFGYERVGEASGLTRFGAHKWFDDGARFLLATQESDGRWTGDSLVGTEGNTAYALLFLSRGRAPVIVQKLQFEGRWNNRPRDAAGFAYFMRRASERHVNWQIVSIDAGAGELREAPLLYLASDRMLNLTDGQKSCIKTYIDQGGLLICANEGRGDDLARSVAELASQLYPQYPMRDLPLSHPLYSANFPVKTPSEPVKGVGNDLRELIVLFGQADMPWKWHHAGGAYTPNNSPYAALANLLLYVTDRANPRFKGEDTWVDRDPGVTPTRSLRVARIQYDGNWNPEPAGWQRLGNVVWNLDRIDLKIEPTSEPTQQALAHLTATRTFQLPAPQIEMLRKYLDNGGLLVLDAAGGSQEAAASLESLLRSLYPEVVIAPLPLDHPIYRGQAFGGRNIESVTYRRSPELQAAQLPRLRGVSTSRRLVAILSYEDLSGGLVGYATGGLVGYSPASATDLMRNTVLWRARRN